MIQGISHLTFATSDLDAAQDFYTQVLGFRLIARWGQGAYLQAGDLWLALAHDATATGRSATLDETHVAFAVSADDFPDLSRRIQASGAAIWRANKSEGPSLYFTDPDGHRLEIHVGTLASRRAALLANPPSGLKLYG